MSVAVALTFGSFGDIATILQLASALVTTLHAASSASDEIREVIEAIDTFTGMVESVRSSMDALEASTCPGAEAARRNIRRSLDICTRLLQRMSAHIQKHRRSFERRYGRQRWRRYWAACTWYLIAGKATPDALRRRLAEQTMAIQTAIQLMNLSVTVEVRAREVEIIVQGGQYSAPSPGNSVKTAGIPFQFFDDEGIAVQPMLTIAWNDFTDLCEQFQFFGNKFAELAVGRRHKQTVYSSNGRKAWFEAYIHVDETQLNPRVVISPVFHILGKSNTARRPPAARSASAVVTVPANVRFLAFTSRHDETFEDARVSGTLTKVFENGYRWLKASKAQSRNDAQIRLLDAPKARNLRLTISRVVGGDYRCTLATTSASHVVAVGSQYYGFDG